MCHLTVSRTQHTKKLQTITINYTLGITHNFRFSMTSTTPFHTAVRVDFYYLTIELRYERDREREHDKKKFIHSNMVKRLSLLNFFHRLYWQIVKWHFWGSLKNLWWYLCVELTLENNNIMTQTRCDDFFMVTTDHWKII